MTYGKLEKELVHAPSDNKVSSLKNYYLRELTINYSRIIY